MGFLESVGALTLLAIGGYLLLNYLSKKDDDEREMRHLIKYSRKCQKLINEYNESVQNGTPIMSHHEMQKKLFKIINEPEEAASIEERIKFEQESKAEYKQLIREHRKIGYKYETEIFEIFDCETELSKSFLLQSIETKFNLNPDKAEELLKIWKVNSLIQVCSWNSMNYEIGRTLTSKSSKLDSSDLTRDEWLELKGKTLKPRSKEYREYIESLDYF